MSRGASTLSSRSHVHVHSQIWRPPAPGLTRSLPSTTTERSVSRPPWPVAVASPSPEAVAVEPLVCVTAPVVPSLSTRIETFVFRAPAWVAVALAPSGPDVSAAAAAWLL